MANRPSTIKNPDQRNDLHFETTSTENIVKAISYNEGKKHEVYTYVMTEEQFEALIPENQKALAISL